MGILGTELVLMKAKSGQPSGRDVVGGKKGILVEAWEAERVVRGANAVWVNRD